MKFSYIFIFYFQILMVYIHCNYEQIEKFGIDFESADMSKWIDNRGNNRSKKNFVIIINVYFCIY